jgi:hypothetical protein
VLLNGTVNGDVANNGGRLEINGTVNGHVHDMAGQTVIDPDAVVRPPK